ncbi:hypothetical protein BDV09DRAFT_200176 [Aspergillus tetrazonus]
MNPCFLTTQVLARAHAQDAQDARGQVDVRVYVHVPVHARIPAPVVQDAALIQVREESGEGQEDRVQILVRDDGGEEGQEGQGDSEVYVRADWEDGLREVLRRLDYRIPTEAHEDRDRDVLLVVRLAVEQGDVRDGGGERISPLWRDGVIDKVKIVQQIPRSLDRYKYPDEPGSSELALNILLRPKVTSTTWLQERGIRSGAALLDPYQPTAR